MERTPFNSPKYRSGNLQHIQLSVQSRHFTACTAGGEDVGHNGKDRDEGHNENAEEQEERKVGGSG